MRCHLVFIRRMQDQTQAVSADITAEVAGNAAAFSFGDSAGNSASGNLTFDNGQLYLRVSTAEPVSSVYPNVSCIMSRNQVILNPPEPTATPTPSEGAAAGYRGERGIFLPGEQQPLSYR